jgi:D-alanyl-D-alanine carboxypeptidase (penicillin-binding protein 5/6)
MRWRRRGGVALGAAVLSAGVVGGVLAPASAALPATKPPPPVCATAVAYSSGTATSAPVPLPPPASDAGGTRLAQPGLQVQLKPGTPAPPRLRASAWIVADLTTGNVIAACNAHVPLAPASTLKVLTALALHPRLDPQVRYTARQQDAAADGTKVGLAPGSVYTIDNLWHGLLMGSGNDAANALATLAGGAAKATTLMTSTARSLGARDTVVANTSGLDAPGQVSSVYDLALFGRALLRDPGLAALVRTTTYRFPAAGHATSKSGGRKTYQIQNHNRLLLSYPGTTGIKNGYTSAAGASLVASATRGGHSYVVAMLRSDVNVWSMAGSLLDWAFGQNGGAEPVGRLDGTPAPPGAAAPTTAPQSSAALTSESRNQYAPAPAAVPPVVAGPVRQALQTMPEGQRTGLLLAVLALALAGGTMVRRLALARSGPRSRPGTKRKGRTPTRRSPTATSRPTPKRATTTARRPVPRRSR